MVTITISNPCASDVSGSIAVTRSGFLYNAGTRRFSQTLTITNASGAAINGPLAVVLDNLSGNATLFNASGATACVAPAGRPYIASAANALAPGASMAMLLQFTNPTKAAITYGTQVLAGAGSR